MNSKHGTRVWRYFSLLALLITLAFSTAAQAGYSVSLVGVDWYGPNNAPYTVFHYSVSWVQDPNSQNGLSHVDLGGCFALADIDFAHSTPGAQWVTAGTDNSFAQCDPAMIVGNVVKFPPPLGGLPSGGSMIVDLALFGLRSPGGTAGWWVKAGTQSCASGSAVGTCGPTRHPGEFLSCTLSDLQVCGTGTVALTPVVTDLYPVASYLWSNGATTPSVNVGSGNYGVTITDTHGFSTTCQANVSVNPPPVAQISGDLRFCEGGSTTLTASGGVSYLWSTGEVTPVISVTSGGSYTVTVTSDKGCKDSKTVIVVADKKPNPKITASGLLKFCEGGSVTLTASGADSYLWSNGATTDSITVSTSGTYSVTGTNNNSTCGPVTSAAVVVTVDKKPTAEIAASGPLTFCEGGSVTLTASGGLSYHWSNGASGPSINVTESGTYTVTSSNENTCDSATASVTVQVDKKPVPKITASGPLTFCEGGSVTLTASGGVSYHWSNGVDGPSITVSDSGTYTVTASNQNSCSTADASATVTVDKKPTAKIDASGPLTFCEGGSVTLTASGGLSYHWSNGASGPSINVTESGTYTVTSSNENTCDSATASVTVQVDKKPTPHITASGPLTFCEGGSVTLTASGGVSYHWSNGVDGPSITVSDSGTYTVTASNQNSCSTADASAIVTVDKKPTAKIDASGPLTFCEGGSVTLTASGGLSYHWSNGGNGASITVTESGTYTVTSSNENTCDSATASVTVQVDKKPTPHIAASGPLTFCEGGSVTLTASGGVSYHWSNGVDGPSITVSDSGTYTVTASNQNSCSTATDSVTVQVDKKPVPKITASGPLSFCQGGRVTLTASGGTSYHWSTGDETASITVTDKGTYTVTVSNNNTCDPASATVVVDVFPCPSACTLTQGAWGSTGGAGKVGDVSNAIGGYYGGSLSLGLPANNSAFTANTADAPCVVAALPGGGPAAAIGSLATFNSNCTTNPKALLKNGKFNNVLLGQTFALSLNVTSNAKLIGPGLWYSTFPSMPLDYTITTGTVVNGLPISQTTYTLGKAGAMAKNVGTLLDMANQALGNGLAAKYPGLSISDVNMAVDAVNRAFDGCRSEIAVGPVAPLTPQAMSLAAKGTDICDGSRVIELNGQTSRLDLPASVLDAMARLNLAPTVESLATIDDMVMRGEAVDGVVVDDLTTAVNTINHIAIEGRFIIPCNQ